MKEGVSAGDSMQGWVRVGREVVLSCCWCQVGTA